MNENEVHQSRLTTPDEVAAAISSDTRLAMRMAMAEPPPPFKALADRARHLSEHVDEPGIWERIERCAGWSDRPIDLPGRHYLQSLRELFPDDRLIDGTIVGFGRATSTADIKCPTYLMVGADDRIDTPMRVNDARSRLPISLDGDFSDTLAGGHVGPFMSHRTVGDIWPGVEEALRHNDDAVGGP